MAGDLFHPSEPWNPKILSDWHLFFSAIQRRVPVVLASLEKDVLPVLRTLPSAGTEPSGTRNRYVPLISPLTDWASKYNLPPSRYVFGIAVNCLEYWGRSELGRSKHRVPFPATASTTRAIDFSFGFPGWQFDLEEWNEFEKGAQEFFLKELHRYRDAVLTAAKARGYISVKKKRARASSDVTVHFEWAALRLCGNAPISTIADLHSVSGASVTEDAIRKGVAEVAARLGLSTKN